MERIEIEFIKSLYLDIFLALIFTLMISIIANLSKKNLASFKNLFSLVSIALISFHFGFRKSEVGTDTKTYEYIYEYIRAGNSIVYKDFLWDILMKGFTLFFDTPSFFFLIVSILYIVLPYLGFKKILEGNSIYFLMMFLIVPNFFLYGANGIRSGLAASIFLFSFRFHERKYVQYSIILLSILTHASLIVPSFFYLVSAIQKNIKISLTIWLIALPFAFLGISLLSLLPIQLDRMAVYSVSINNDLSVKISNFLVYSISPILLGIYLVYSKGVKDTLYIRLLNTYIYSNIIYVLAFNLEFSERFAYLSELLMPFLLVYPIFKFKVFKYGGITISLIMICIFLLKAFKIFIM
ncbi:EpsG family protein [Sphingobacterium multivorum]|uniref:EpsG family protein n=1 Tax=Sphingobacterium multivorum TaxID=28454 RepID=UPI003DA3E4D1